MTRQVAGDACDRNCSLQGCSPACRKLFLAVHPYDVQCWADVICSATAFTVCCMSRQSYAAAYLDDNHSVSHDHCQVRQVAPPLTCLHVGCMYHIVCTTCASSNCFARSASCEPVLQRVQNLCACFVMMLRVHMQVSIQDHALCLPLAKTTSAVPGGRNG